MRRTKTWLASLNEQETLAIATTLANVLGAAEMLTAPFSDAANVMAKELEALRKGTSGMRKMEDEEKECRARMERAMPRLARVLQDDQAVSRLERSKGRGRRCRK